MTKDELARTGFLQRVQVVSCEVLSPNPQSARPSLRLVAPASGDSLQRLLEVLGWAVNRVRGRAS